jgi:outer membrane immunogenic protein
MKLRVLLFASVFASAVVATAQESAPTPKAEVGLNYSYTRVNPGNGLGSYNANGGFGDVEYNINKTLGVVAELGGSYTGTGGGLQLNNTSFEYLFGPRINLRHGRFNPYAQALFGGQRLSNGWNPSAADPRLGASQNNFAMAFGGGLNYTVNDRFAVRPFQLDYFATRIAPPNNSYLQNDLRYSAGVVFRFGSK